MKAAELRDLDADALRAKETELDDQLFRMRIQKSMGQLEAPGKVKDVRRDLARIKTILGEKSDVPAGKPANPRAAGKAK
jgi:large subunit ribosomal protein L29